jgi:hypothetical protein
VLLLNTKRAVGVTNATSEDFLQWEADILLIAASSMIMPCFHKDEKRLDHTVIYRVKPRAKSFDQKRVDALLAVYLQEALHI